MAHAGRIVPVPAGGWTSSTRHADSAHRSASLSPPRALHYPNRIILPTHAQAIVPLTHRGPLLALLLLAFQLAQAALLVHEYDIAAHAGDDECLICLHATPAKHAATASAVPPPLAANDAVAVAAAVPVFTARPQRPYAARAPPGSA